MKLKLGFKVTPKDLIIFAIFCVFLLYFSSIAVANIYALINDGEFYGFNPIEGLTFKYLPVTLLVFFGILIAISTLVFVLSIFYVDAKYIFFVISIALTRFILNNILLVDIEPDKFIVLMVDAFKWLDILLAITTNCLSQKNQYKLHQTKSNH